MIKPAPGLRPIKQVEMRDKWRPLVPPEYADDPIYQEPSEDVRLKVKGDRKAKKKATTAATTAS